MGRRRVNLRLAQTYRAFSTRCRGAGFPLEFSFAKRPNPMSLRAQLTDAMKEAMKAKDARRLATVRMVLAALKDRDIAARSETSRDLLGDDEILSLLAKMI